MPVNSSSPDASLPPPSLSSYSSVFLGVFKCFKTTFGSVSITTFTIMVTLLLLPLGIFVLYLGIQQWRQQRSNTKVSHSDIFTYHVIVMELMSIVGSILACFGIYTDLPQMIIVGIILFVVNYSGETLIHILTCVDRYLAVVHPVIYLKLRNKTGVRIRNISIGCVWLASFAGISLLYMKHHVHIMLVLFFCSTGLSLIAICFCSLSVLCVLIRPGPGEGGGRQGVDQSKLRAFYTIMAILAVLVFRFIGSMLTRGLYRSLQLLENERCAVMFCVMWFGLPSSLVLPLLFLQRAGKLLCCRTNNESGQRSD